jgi:hypothetical protein
MVMSWFEPHITSLLTDKQNILDSWRRQIPTIQGRTKNFENWLLVELVDRISRIAEVIKLRTNGNLSKIKIKAAEIDGLSGSKSKATHLSPDISILLNKDNSIICTEIKTGLAPKELLNDIKVVNHYTTIGVCKQAEFLWVVLLPVGEIENRRSAKSHEKTFKKMRENRQGFSFVRKEITPWLILVIAVKASD